MATYFEGVTTDGTAVYTAVDSAGIHEHTLDLGFILDNLEYQFLTACINQGLPHPAIDRLNDCTPVFDENEDLIWEDYDPEGCLPEYESPFPDYHGEEFRACSELWTYPVEKEVVDAAHKAFNDNSAEIDALLQDDNIEWVDFTPKF